MNLHRNTLAATLAGALAMGAAGYLIFGHYGARAYANALPTHQTARAKDGGVTVQLCDGVTSTEVKGLKPGQQMSRRQALEVTRGLMAQWQRKHPNQHWVMAQAEKSGTPQASSTAHAASAALAPGGSANIAGPGAAAAEKLKSQQGDTYASFHERDFKIWKAQTDAFVEYGSQVFHSAQLLGSTIGVSCDMCHPNASNTHPETYPKYQVQLQRVALLRDMIDWCIENPVKGKTLSPNDPKMRALEAYILAARKGVPLDYGKH
jgi:thiosulfate dehydrogenase